MKTQLMQPHSDRQHFGPGILMAILATIAYAAADTLSKYQAQQYPVEMIVWARYFVPFTLMLIIYLPRLGLNLLRTAFIRIQIVRGLLLTAGTVLIVFAYRIMPMAEAQAISFIHPVLLTLLAVLFLGERVSLLGWIAVLLGFSGVLIIIRPGGGLFTPAALLPLGLAFSFSSYQIFTRMISDRENSMKSLFYVLLIGSLVMSLTLPFSWIRPTPRGCLLFLLVGVCSGLGYFATIRSLELAPASLLAPFAYIQLLWIGILGALVFGDIPDVFTLLGMAVVVAGGLLVAASKPTRT